MRSIGKSERKMFISKSVSFAIEMVRVALCNIPTDVRLRGIWMQTNMIIDVSMNERCMIRNVSLAILIDPDIWVSANCTVKGAFGKWTSGDVKVSILGKRPYCDRIVPSWKFHCELNNGQLDIQPMVEGAS